MKRRDIIENFKINEYLQNLDMQIKKVPGTYYYLYKINSQDKLSIIAPDEWGYMMNF